LRLQAHSWWKDALGEISMIPLVPACQNLYVAIQDMPQFQRRSSTKRNQGENT
jgi:hypothetical protein